MQNLSVVPALKAQEPVGAAQAAPATAPAFPMPEYFATAKGAKKLKAAWEDLVSAAADELKVPSNRFMFEMTAVLLSRFRDGKSMNATDSKELKKNLVFLGLAQGDEDSGGRKAPKKTDKYFE